MAEYMRRFATGLDQYEFAEVRSEDFDDFVVAAEMMAAHVSGRDAATDKAIENLEKGGLRTSLPGLKKPAGSPFGQKQQAGGSDDPVDLGEYEGYKVRFYPKGKFGPYFNAYQKGANPERINANLPKGMSADQVSLEVAIEALTNG